MLLEYHIISMVFFSPSLKLNAVSLPDKTGQKIYPVKISIVEKVYLFR